jgi:hypothetical protein
MRDSNIPINNVEQAFGSIRALGSVHKWEEGAISYPSGGHLQGIQRLSNRPGNELTYVISGSADDESFFIIIEKTSAASPQEDGGNGNPLKDIPGAFANAAVLCVHKVAGKPYQHAGGLQVIGDVLVIGAEDDDNKDKSKVFFYNLEDPANPVKLPVEIDRAGDSKKATAGAVGIVKREADHLLAVGAWDSKTIDFYLSNGKSLDDPGCSFHFERTWHKNDADKHGWIDKNWAKYQGLNLVAQPGGGLFLIGFNRKCNKDWADLYTLDMNETIEKWLHKKAKLHVTCKEGASFRWGGGVFCADETRIALYATERDIHTRTTYNQCWFD